MKPRIASMWLGGCSGCHMSFLDMDEFLLDLFDQADYVYGPLVDTKTFPENVDVVLVEGAVANQDNLELLHQARRNSRVLVAFGDCAVTGNVTAMRNPLGGARVVLERSYNWSHSEPVPALVDRVEPLHRVVRVDYYIAGCPPPADRIKAVLVALLEGREPELGPADRRFG